MASSNTPEPLFTHTASKLRLPLDLPSPRAAYTPSPHPEEQRGPYLHHEWTEEHGWYARIVERYNKVYKESLTTCTVTEAQLVSDRARYKPCTEEEVENYEKTLASVQPRLAGRRKWGAFDGYDQRCHSSAVVGRQRQGASRHSSYGDHRSRYSLSSSNARG